MLGDVFEPCREAVKGRCRLEYLVSAEPQGLGAQRADWTFLGLGIDLRKTLEPCRHLLLEWLGKAFGLDGPAFDPPWREKQKREAQVGQCVSNVIPSAYRLAYMLGRLGHLVRFVHGGAKLL